MNWLGDAVMTTPALERLREAHPRAHIALLTPAKLADLWRHHPDIDQALTFEPDESVLSVARHLRPLDFDTALILPNSPRSALEAFLARIPRRLGHARPWRNWLLTERVQPRAAETAMRKRTPAEVQRLISGGELRKPSPAPSPQAHHIHQYLHLAAALGANSEAVAPRLAVTDAEINAISARFGFQPSGTVSRPRLLGINAGAEYGPAKRWPRERFIEAAARVQSETGCHVWIFGGPSEVEFARAISAAFASAPDAPPGSVHCLAGQTSLRELCAALAACDALLTNDSGPMHVAAAVGTPVVVPFGSTSPVLTAPGLPGDARHQLLRTGVACSPCFLRECPIDFRCMTGISVERMATAAVKALALK